MWKPPKKCDKALGANANTHCEETLAILEDKGTRHLLIDVPLCVSCYRSLMTEKTIGRRRVSL